MVPSLNPSTKYHPLLIPVSPGCPKPWAITKVSVFSVSGTRTKAPNQSTKIGPRLCSFRKSSHVDP